MSRSQIAKKKVYTAAGAFLQLLYVWSASPSKTLSDADKHQYEFLNSLTSSRELRIQNANMF